MIYYLAQKYTGIEEQAKNDAQKWTGLLIDKICRECRWMTDGIFSPVMHTHQFDVEYGRSSINLNYVGWDLALANAMKKELIMLFAPTCFKNTKKMEWASKGAKQEYEWAKQNNVPCLHLNPFLDGKEVEVLCQ